MRSRPRKTPANDSKTRQTKRRAADAQSGAVKSAGHQGAETSDGAQPEADVARDAADAAATAQTGPEMAGDEPGAVSYTHLWQRSLRGHLIGPVFLDQAQC